MADLMGGGVGRKEERKESRNGGESLEKEG